MSQSEIIEFVQSKGAEVKVRKFDGATKADTICVNFGKIAPEESYGIEAWRHGIFIDVLMNRWVLGFSQSAKTQPLEKAAYSQNAILFWALCEARN